MEGARFSLLLNDSDPEGSTIGTEYPEEQVTYMLHYGRQCQLLEGRLGEEHDTFQVVGAEGMRLDSVRVGPLAAPYGQANGGINIATIWPVECFRATVRL